MMNSARILRAVELSPSSSVSGCFFCTRSPDRAKHVINKQKSGPIVSMKTAVIILLYIECYHGELHFARIPRAAES